MVRIVDDGGVAIVDDLEGVEGPVDEGCGGCPEVGTCVLDFGWGGIVG